MNYNNAISGLPKVLENLGLGVMECWRVGVLKKDIEPSPIIPALHCSNTPRLIKSINLST
jgi:hypothetical protein